MKKIYTLVAAAFLICCTTNLTFAQAKKVLYITQNKGTNWDAAAAREDNDAIVQMLRRDNNLDVTVRVLSSDEVGIAATPIDFAPYDVIVVQESLGGGSAILTPAGTLGLAKFTKPTIYNKPFALAAGRAFAASTAGGGTDASPNSTVVEGVHTPGPAVLAMTVPAENRSNVLFNGITFGENGNLTVFNAGATDNAGVPTGTQAYKGFSFSNATVIDPAQRPLATFTPAVTDRAIAETGTPVFLNDVASGAKVGSETLQARMILMGMNYGALNKDGGTNITREGLTLWRNAIYSLAGLTVPTTLVEANVTSTKPEVENAFFTLSQNYPNPSNGSTTISFELKKAGPVALEVYDVTGRKVATLANGTKAAGAHEVKLENNNLKGGMYIYRLTTDGATASRTMLVTK